MSWFCSGAQIGCAALLDKRSFLGETEDFHENFFAVTRGSYWPGPHLAANVQVKYSAGEKATGEFPDSFSQTGEEGSLLSRSYRPSDPVSRKYAHASKAIWVCGMSTNPNKLGILPCFAFSKKEWFYMMENLDSFPVSLVDSRPSLAKWISQSLISAGQPWKWHPAIVNLWTLRPVAQVNFHVLKHISCHTLPMYGLVK